MSNFLTFFGVQVIIFSLLVLALGFVFYLWEEHMNGERKNFKVDENHKDFYDGDYD